MAKKKAIDNIIDLTALLAMQPETMAMTKAADKPYFGNGIALAAGFDLGAKTPLDSRTIAKTIAERDAHVTGNRAYDGLLVFVEEDKKTYQLIDGAWKEFGFNAGDFAAGIVDSLDSTATDKALSANQGRVLKELVDAIAAREYILTRTMDVIATEVGVVEYNLLTKPAVNNMVIDVNLNSTVLIAGEDYTIEGNKITLAKAKNFESTLHIVYTYVSQI